MRAKINEGDLVTINDRCPKWLSGLLRRNRKRRVLSVYYNPERECRYFYLGTNKQGEAAGFIEQYPFRSYMLDQEVTGRGIGRPKKKRRYKRRHTAPSTFADEGLPQKRALSLVVGNTGLCCAI